MWRRSHASEDKRAQVNRLESVTLQGPGGASGAPASLCLLIASPVLTSSGVLAPESDPQMSEDIRGSPSRC